MGIETNPTRVDDLNESWPAAGEPVKEGHLHLKNIKKVVKARANVAGGFGVTTLSNALNSTDETKAATAAAAKALRDLITALENENLPTASTTVAGIVQLNNATDSTSTTQAATANAVRLAIDEAIAGVTFPTALGAVGTYAMLARADANAANPGTTLAGSSLRYAGASADISIEPTANLVENSISTTAPAGTWRCMGFLSGVDSFNGPDAGDDYSIKYATLWLRIS